MKHDHKCALCTGSNPRQGQREEKNQGGHKNYFRRKAKWGSKAPDTSKKMGEYKKLISAGCDIKKGLSGQYEMLFKKEKTLTRRKLRPKARKKFSSHCLGKTCLHKNSF